MPIHVAVAHVVWSWSQQRLQWGIDEHVDHQGRHQGDHEEHGHEVQEELSAAGQWLVVRSHVRDLGNGRLL